jgi:hypothetical protein
MPFVSASKKSTKHKCRASKGAEEVDAEEAEAKGQADRLSLLAFGTALWFWMWDVPQGYNQIRIAKDSQEKLAFAGPNATK